MQKRHRPASEADPAHTDAVQTVRTLRARMHLLHRISALPSHDVDGQLDTALRLIVEAFDADHGIISHVEGDTYTIRYVQTPDNALASGDTFPLGETYCSLTMQAGTVVAIEHMADSAHRDHPGYARFALESYLGAPLLVNGEPYGTLHVSTAAPRPLPFTEDDRAFMELLARWVGVALERRQAEADLHRREEHYRSLFENALEGIFVSTPEGTILEANPALARMLGYEDADAVKAHLNAHDLFPVPDDRRQLLEQLRKDQVLDGVELTLKTRTGAPLIVRERSRAFFDDDGNLVSIMGRLSDITRQAQAEEERQTQTALYHELVNSTSAILWKGDARTFAFTFVSEAAETLLGYPRERWLEDPNFWVEHIHPDDREWAPAFCARATAERRRHTFDYRMIAADGRTVWLRDVVNVLTENDRPVRLVGVMLDITEQKEAERQLREAEAKFRALVEQSLTGIYIIQDGRFVYVNPMLADIFGYTPEEIITGCTVADLVAEPDRNLVLENIRRRLDAETDALRYAFRGRRRDGRLIHVEVHGTRTIYGGRPAVIGTLLDVTERMETEAALRESEARLQAVVSALPDALFRLNRDGVYLDYIAAEGFEPMVPPEVFLGKNLGDFLPHSVAAKAGSAIRQALDTRTRQHFEYGLPAETTEEYYEARLIPDGPDAVLAFVRNITGRKRSERALQESEQRLRLALTAARGATFFCDFVHDVTRWDEGSLRMFGIDVPDGIVAYETWLACVHPDDRKPLAERYEAALATDEEFDLEYRIIRPDGEVRFIRATGLITRNALRQAAYVYGLHFDVTERKQAEARLLQALRLNKLLLETALDGYLLADTEGNVVDANPAYCRELGYTREELLTMNVRDLEATLTPDEVKARIARLVEHGKARFQTRHRHKDGHALDFDVSIAIVQPGERPLVAAFMRNISDQIHAQQEREQLISELEARNAELERFTYSVSHDLKSPLVTIQGFLGLLRRDLESTDLDSVEKDLHYISNAAMTMQRLLDELLELSRIGRLINPAEVIALDELVREALDLVAGEVTARGVDIVLTTALPRVFGDRTRLREVFQNLIGNAIKFMGDQPHPRIEIGVEHHVGEARCFIRDNGIGIPPAYHEKIFGLFERLDNRVEGTGIGLALCKRIIELHGGRIWVASEGPGQGSTFYVVLPSIPPTGS